MLSILNKIIRSLILFKPLLKILVKLMKIIAVTGKGSDTCLKEGFLPMPVHYYSPVPDIDDLAKRNIWKVRSELKGVNFRQGQQVELLQRLGKAFSDECKWPLKPTDNITEFNLMNPSFSYGCAASTHCIIRKNKPSVLIEIGSGLSSKVISGALAMNFRNDGTDSSYIIVDPYPADFIKDDAVKIKELYETRVELLDPAVFDQLKGDDILFIDSGHCVKIGGDVNFLFLDILPRLRPGVIVHVHDIAFPYEYPKAYATSETFRQFWTEQYLLQSFLCFNNEFQVLLAMNYLMTDHSEVFRKTFSFYDPDIHPFISGSFWMMRKKR